MDIGRTAFAFICILAIAAAAPAPPEMLIKNSTKECMAFNAGDECTNCKIPTGWTSLGYMTSDCPEGFTEVERNYTCSPGRNQRCCSEGHSGSLGDCAGILIDDNTKQCAFPSADCTPGTGWIASDPKSGGRQCPMDYRWAESACASDGLDMNGTCCASAAILVIVFIGAAIIRREQ